MWGSEQTIMTSHGLLTNTQPKMSRRIENKQLPSLKKRTACNGGRSCLFQFIVRLGRLQMRGGDIRVLTGRRAQTNMYDVPPPAESCWVQTQCTRSHPLTGFPNSCIFNEGHLNTPYVALHRSNCSMTLQKSLLVPDPLWLRSELQPAATSRIRSSAYNI